MCDTIVTKNISKKNHPEFVYKLVQKVGEGQYISPVMGEPMKLGVWKKAPSRKISKTDKKSCLVNLLKRKWKKRKYACSSEFSNHHNGMWGSFRLFIDAHYTTLVTNFVDENAITLPQCVVQCEVKGTVHSAKFSCDPSFLSSHIKIIREMSYDDYKLFEQSK